MEGRREHGVEDDAISGRVIGAAIAVHRALGPGFVEAVYEEALAIELAHCDIAFERQVAVPIVYRSKSIGSHRLDLLIERSLVVELKSVVELTDQHFAIVRSYLRATRRPFGLLFNFATARLTKHRVYATKELARSR